MKPVKAWAVTLPRKLHPVLSMIPYADRNAKMAYPVFATRKAAVEAANAWILVGLSAKVMQVTIAEQEAL